MSDEILSCDGTDEVRKADWSNIIGDKTIDDGGFFGDLLQISRLHIEEAKNRGELREQDAGVAYSSAIMESMKEAIRFELDKTKNQLELCFLQAQIDKLRADIENDKCLAEAECKLKAAQTLEVEESTKLVTEKIESENKHNEPDGIYDQQIYKMKEDVLIAKEEVKLAISKESREYVAMLGDLDKNLGYDYQLDNNGNVIRNSITDSGDGKLDAEVRTMDATANKVEYEVSDILPAEKDKIIEETDLITEKIESEDKHNTVDGIYDQQIYKMQEDVKIAKTQVALEHAKSIAEIDKVMGYEYTLDADGNIVVGADAGDGKMDAEVDLLVAQKDLTIEQDNEIPKESARRDCTTAAECKVKDAQVIKLECECENDTTMTDSKVSLNAAQENKYACDCCNSSKIASSQSALYERQIEGFNDNANQKLYDSQLQAWSMVFSDTEMDAVTPSIVDNQICETYTRLRNRLAGTWDENGNFIPGSGVVCEGSSYTESSGYVGDYPWHLG